MEKQNRPPLAGHITAVQSRAGDVCSSTRSQRCADGGGPRKLCPSGPAVSAFFYLVSLDAGPRAVWIGYPFARLESCTSRALTSASHTCARVWNSPHSPKRSSTAGSFCPSPHSVVSGSKVTALIRHGTPLAHRSADRTGYGT
eukprot:5594131-Pyramimonas_sp.AAC.1